MSVVVIYLLLAGTALLEQQRMKVYLKNKYNQEFDVTKPELSGAGIGMDGVWQARANPKNDTSLEFGVSRVQSQNQLNDSYVASVWTKEETSRIQDLKREIFVDLPVEVEARISSIGKLKNVATLKSPTFREALNKYPADLYYQVIVKHVGASTDTKDMAQRISKIVEAIRASGVRDVGVYYIELSTKMGENSLGQDCGVDDSKSASSIEECIKNKVELNREDIR